MNTRAKGIDGETVVCEYLEKRGVRIVERNHSEKCGEIDVIAEEKGVLLFVEVKSRNGNAFGDALESVTPAKIAKIVKTAELYMVRRGIYPADCRFDVAVVKNGELDEYIPNAFTRADGGRKNRW